MAREPEIVVRYRQLAEQNDPVAQFKLGEPLRRSAEAPVLIS
jgi:hypothetical protein